MTAGDDARTRRSRAARTMIRGPEEPGATDPRRPTGPRIKSGARGRGAAAGGGGRVRLRAVRELLPGGGRRRLASEWRGRCGVTGRSGPVSRIPAPDLVGRGTDGSVELGPRPACPDPPVRGRCRRVGQRGDPSGGLVSRDGTGCRAERLREGEGRGVGRRALPRGRPGTSGSRGGPCVVGRGGPPRGARGPSPPRHPACTPRAPPVHPHRALGAAGAQRGGVSGWGCGRSCGGRSRSWSA